MTHKGELDVHRQVAQDHVVQVACMKVFIYDVAGCSLDEATAVVLSFNENTKMGECGYLSRISASVWFL